MSRSVHLPKSSGPVHARGIHPLRTSARAMLAALALLATTTSHAADSDSPVTAWLNAQTNIQSWTADVKQVRSFRTLAQPLVETGKVWFAAPNQFRWEIGSPAKTIAIRLSDQMLVIYPRLKRAERFPLDGAQAGPWKETLALLEAGFPRDREELEARFRIVSENCTNETCEVQLQPRAASARRMMPRLNVTFSTNDHTLRATELHFADGSFMRNEFSGGRINPRLDPETFRPQLGAEIEIVEPLRQKSR